MCDVNFAVIMLTNYEHLYAYFFAQFCYRGKGEVYRILKELRLALYYFKCFSACNKITQKNLNRSWFLYEALAITFMR